jgi:hypothetical protein
MMKKLIFCWGYVSARCFDWLRSVYQSPYDKVVRYIKIPDEEGTEGERNIVHVNGTLKVHFDPRYYVVAGSARGGGCLTIELREDPVETLLRTGRSI